MIHQIQPQNTSMRKPEGWVIHHVGHQQCLSVSAQTQLGACWTGTVEQFFPDYHPNKKQWFGKCADSGMSSLWWWCLGASMLSAKTLTKSWDDCGNWSMLRNNAPDPTSTTFACPSAYFPLLQSPSQPHFPSLDNTISYLASIYSLNIC